MPPDAAWLPLFPLNTVLFPEGVLPLRVFETRYIDMVRDCMKHDSAFGVVLIKSGQEVGLAAEPETVGCIAHITDWDMKEPGVMSLTTRGDTRFRILDTRVLPDQRLEARIETIAPDADTAISAEHAVCAEVLKAVIADIDAKGQLEQGESYLSPFPSPQQWNSATWVSNRWCELLPVPLKARQKLLELDDARSRLAIVHQYLQQHDIL